MRLSSACQGTSATSNIVIKLRRHAMERRARTAATAAFMATRNPPRWFAGGEKNISRRLRRHRIEQREQQQPGEEPADMRLPRDALLAAWQAERADAEQQVRPEPRREKN